MARVSDANPEQAGRVDGAGALPGGQPAGDNAASRTLLKVLGGVQAGAEVALPPGEFGLGADEADDLQFIDATLMPRHARLRVGAGTIEIRAGEGAVLLAGGERLEAGNETWRAVEPLEIITLGALRLALGPPSARWTSLTDMPAAPAPASPVEAAPPATLEATVRRWPVTLVLPLAFLLIGALGAWLALSGPETSRAAVRRSPAQQLETVRQALAPLPFARPLETRQDVDGTIFVTGLVESPVERRALASAIEATDIAVRLRIGVMATLRSEIDALLQAEKAPLTYTITPDGVVRLEGLLLDEARLGRLAERLQQTILGISRVELAVRTARTLLGEVEGLAQLAKIDPFIVLRLDGELIEASGAIPTDRIDGWVGFLQSYSRRFAREIALRSLVRLQNPDGSTAPAPAREQALVLGTAGPTGQGQPVDIERLRQGRFELSDVFVGPAGAATAIAARPFPAPEPPRPRSEPVDDGVTVTRSLGPARPALPTPNPAQPPPPLPPAPNPAPSQAQSQAQSPAPPVPELPPGMRMAGKAEELLGQWRMRRGGGTSETGPGPAEAGLLKTLDDVSAARARLGTEESLAERWGPLVSRDALRGRADDACWPGARLTLGNVGAVLFWLDMLSVSSAFTLKRFDLDEQGLILEAGLNPGQTGACLARSHAGRAGTPPASLYLAETQLNPAFVNYLAGGLTAYPLDVTGVNLGARYLQTRNGQRLGQGAAPDAASRLAIIGELGAAIRNPQGYAVVIYQQNLNWLVR